MNTRPCPDCAHTEHPGQYVGIFRREPCRSCNGSATVSTEAPDRYLGALESLTLTFDGQPLNGYDPKEGLFDPRDPREAKLRDQCVEALEAEHPDTADAIAECLAKVITKNLDYLSATVSPGGRIDFGLRKNAAPVPIQNFVGVETRFFSRNEREELFRIQTEDRIRRIRKEKNKFDRADPFKWETQPDNRVPGIAPEPPPRCFPELTYQVTDSEKWEDKTTSEILVDVRDAIEKARRIEFEAVEERPGVFKCSTPRRYSGVRHDYRVGGDGQVTRVTLPGQIRTIDVEGDIDF